MNKYMSNLECLGLIVGCLCHDLDHRGTNNAFQTKYVIISVKPTTTRNAYQFTSRQTWWALLTTVCWAFFGRCGSREKRASSTLESRVPLHFALYEFPTFPNLVPRLLSLVSRNYSAVIPTRNKKTKVMQNLGGGGGGQIRCIMGDL